MRPKGKILTKTQITARINKALQEIGPGELSGKKLVQKLKGLNAGVVKETGREITLRVKKHA